MTGLPLKVVMPGCPCKTPGSHAGVLPAGGCQCSHTIMRKHFLALTAKLLWFHVYSRLVEKVRCVTLFCLWLFLPNTKDPEKQQQVLGPPCCSICKENFASEVQSSYSLGSEVWTLRSLPGVVASVTSQALGHAWAGAPCPPKAMAGPQWDSAVAKRP